MMEGEYVLENEEGRQHRSAPSLTREARLSFIERKKEKPLESLDFDEAESDIWQKVLSLFISFFIHSSLDYD